MRTLWYDADLDMPKTKTKKYIFGKDAVRCTTDGKLVTEPNFEISKGVYSYRAAPVFDPHLPNLIGSKMPETRKHAPVIDLDIDHVFVQSTTPGHTHLYINVPISFWRYTIMTFGLCVGKTVSWKNFFHLLRARQGFVRVPGLKKPEDAAKS